MSDDVKVSGPGRRIPLIKDMQPGDYGQLPNGDWYGHTPNGHACNLAKHKVTEHEDGTITVSPSILIFYTHPDTNQRVELWHGYLEHGVWRSC